MHEFDKKVEKIIDERQEDTMSFYFAWVDEGEKFRPEHHKRNDEHIFNMDIVEKEGGIPYAKVHISHPKVGLLDAGRKQHAMISYENDQGLHLLFKGKVVAFPRKIDGETIEIEFIAEHENSQDQVQELTKTLQSKPYWDPLFVQKGYENDPSECLESSNQLFQWCRTTGRVTLSNLFYGRKTLNLGGNFFYDSLQMRVCGSPLENIQVNVHVSWCQQYRGQTDLSHLFRGMFPSGIINTYSGPDLQQKWWRRDEKIGRSGYWVDEAFLKEIPAPNTGVLKLYPQYSQKFRVSPEDPLKRIHHDSVRLKRYWYKGKLVLGWNYKQRRKETLSFTLKQNVQSLGAIQNRTKTLNLYLRDINAEHEYKHWQSNRDYPAGDFVYVEGQIYRCLNDHKSKAEFKDDTLNWHRMRDKNVYQYHNTQGAFFVTDRGKQALEHAFEVARSHLQASARAVEISVECLFDHGVELSCDQSLEIHDDRIPGGKAIGKISEYRLIARGKEGKFWAQIKCVCALGEQKNQDEPVQIEANNYVVDEFLEAHQPQLVEPLITRSRTGIAYRSFADQMNQDPLHYPEMLTGIDLVEGLEVLNNANEQEEHLQQNQYPASHDLIGVLNHKKTDIRLVLRDLRSIHCKSQQYNVDVLTTITPPSQIKL